MAQEDFTTWSDTKDDNSRFTITASKVEADHLYETEDAWHADDKGAGALLDVDDVHTFKVLWTDGSFGNGVSCAFAVLSNMLDDFKYLYGNYEPGIGLTRYSNSCDIWETETHNHDGGVGGTFTQNEARYHTWTRTSETNLQAKVYSDASRETLLDTLSLTITSGRRYRYSHALTSDNTGSSSWMDCEIENLDLGIEEGGPAGTPFYYHRRRAT